MIAIALPYPIHGYPMRPVMGARLTRGNVLRIVRQLRGEYLIQPKLNGDRVILSKRGTVEAFNRFGTEYRHRLNLLEWDGLPDGSLLDGEGWRGRFYPFEALQIDGDTLMDKCVTVRAATAKDACRVLGLPWIFDSPSDAWLLNCGGNLPTWEGVVAKRIGTAYEPLARARLDSWQWSKAKW